jgi:hypothetical protein
MGLQPALKNKHWFGIHREPEGGESKSKPENDRFGVSRKLRQNME